MPSITKVFGPYPFAHRAPFHDGQCKLIHGHNWTFIAKFSGTAHRDDLNGFVIDFGKFEFLKEAFDTVFDHGFVVSAADPLLPLFKELNNSGACKLLVLEDGSSSEAIAKFVFRTIADWLETRWPVSGVYADGWVPPYLTEVEVRESEKNSATAYAG